MENIKNYKNTVNISHIITVKKKLEDSFNFILKDLSKVYSQLSKGHKYFKTKSGKSLTEGEIIDCSEAAGNQTIIHKYIVDKIIKNKRIQYSSKPSFVTIKLPWKTIESKSNTYVCYDFKRNEKKETVIRMTIGIQFNNIFEKIFSQLFGGIIPWKKHCIEEMEGLKLVLSN